MKDLSKELVGIYRDVEKILRGEAKGITSGFSRIDYLAGTLEPGNVVIVGGYTGTGKSAFVVNMIQNIMTKESGKNIAVFSTELTKKSYITRQICMMAGIYKLMLVRDPEKYRDRFLEAFGNYKDFMATSTNDLEIFGGITNYHDIETEVLAGNYDIVFVDYIQNLNFGKIAVTSEAMDYIGKGFKDLAMKAKTVIVLVSQVTNYSTNKENNAEKTQLLPFHYAKEAGNASHISLLLQRDKHKGEMSPILDCFILKARDGELGTIPFHIQDGFHLKELTRDEVQGIETTWKLTLDD